MHRGARTGARTGTGGGAGTRAGTLDPWSSHWQHCARWLTVECALRTLCAKPACLDIEHVGIELAVQYMRVAVVESGSSWFVTECVCACDYTYKKRTTLQSLPPRSVKDYNPQHSSGCGLRGAAGV